MQLFLHSFPDPATHAAEALAKDTAYKSVQALPALPEGVLSLKYYPLQKKQRLQEAADRALQRAIEERGKRKTIIDTVAAHEVLGYRSVKHLWSVVMRDVRVPKKNAPRPSSRYARPQFRVISCENALS
jgi:hypothetical protein